MSAILAFILRLLILLFAYSFLGWIVYVIYRDLMGAREDRDKHTLRHITLTAEIDDRKVEKHFTQDEIILGRDPTCDFTLENSTISIRHCKLSFHHKQWWAEDLSSTNGSFLNGTLIDQPVILTDEDNLRLGNIQISIQIQ
jgi:pSer/pThr/pTyr-binding forkhead associated (FHA) protein